MKILKAVPRISLLTVSSSLALGGTGCAGPHTPLGAVWTLKPVQAAPPSTEEREPDPLIGPKIRFTPSRQILHGPSSVVIRIEDPAGDLATYDLNIRYNGFDVTEGFLRDARLSRDWQTRSILIERPAVRLPATSEHQIEFIYRNSTGTKVTARYDAPLCYAFRPERIRNTGDFKPDRNLVTLIDRVSQEEGFNPAFFTGLVAQESRFNPNVVSWAKAVGLTQITTTAEKEIAAVHSAWPRYPGLERMTVDDLRLLITARAINAENEWRLNPKLSVRGGATFVRMLAERWSTPANLAKIRNLFRDPEAAHTKLVLASYHSGYARVQNAIEQYGKNWIKSPELREARKYVNRIFSYCDHFSAPEEGGGGPIIPMRKEKKNARAT